MQLKRISENLMIEVFTQKWQLACALGGKPGQALQEQISTVSPQLAELMEEKVLSVLRCEIGNLSSLGAIITRLEESLQDFPSALVEIHEVDKIGPMIVISGLTPNDIIIVAQRIYADTGENQRNVRVAFIYDSEKEPALALIPGDKIDKIPGARLVIGDPKQIEAWRSRPFPQEILDAFYEMWVNFPHSIKK